MVPKMTLSVLGYLMAVVLVGAAVSAVAVGFRTKEPPKPKHTPFGLVGNCMKLFENLVDRNVINRDNDGVRPSRV